MCTQTLVSKPGLNPAHAIPRLSVFHLAPRSVISSKIVLSVWESPSQTENLPGKRPLYTWEGKTTLKSMLGNLFRWKRVFLCVLVHVCARQGFSCRKHVFGVYMHTRSVSWFGWEIVPEKHPWHHTGSLSWFSLLGQPFSNFFLPPSLLPCCFNVFLSLWINHVLFLGWNSQTPL